MATVSDRHAMIVGMDPVLRDGAFVFCALDGRAAPAEAIATFHEDEGLSAVLPVKATEALGLPAEQPMAWITLQVQSDLEGVGLTAAVSTALAKVGIAANVIAALRHDHVFVPQARAADAMRCLVQLQHSVTRPAP